MIRWVFAFPILFSTIADLHIATSVTLAKDTSWETPLFHVVDLDLGDETSLRISDAGPTKSGLDFEFGPAIRHGRRPDPLRIRSNNAGSPQ